MENEENNGLYTLEDLIRVLEKIREHGSGDLNFPKAIYCLALEIQKIKEKNENQLPLSS